MANELVKMTGGPVAILGDTMNVISETILECKREDAKTERLEIQAEVQKFESQEGTRRILAKLEIEDSRDRRIHEEKMKELDNQYIISCQEYDLKKRSLEIEKQKMEEKMKVANNVLEIIDKTGDMFINIVEKGITNEAVYECFKTTLSVNTNTLISLLNEEKNK